MSQSLTDGSPMTALQKAQEKNLLLSPREKAQLELYENSPESNVGLSPKTSSEFLQLYLAGYITEEIQKLNPGFKLGIIVKARIEHEWDRHKQEYIETLMTQTRESVLKTQLEAVRFSSDGMAVHQKVLGNAFKKYLQTGDEGDLGPHKESINIRNYKEYVALFMQLTGQDGKKQVTAEVTHKTEDPTKVIDVSAVDGSTLLEMMDKK
jgi:hypothetical protein